MKKLFWVLFLSLFMGNVFSQNIQLHYDMGKGRGYLTSTVEMFKPDKLGNTFFFIDMDYSVSFPGASLAYFEIARCFKLGKSPFSWHAEYNGGLLHDNNMVAHTINNAWLTGLDYSWNVSDFSKGFSLKALYKNIEGLSDDKFGTNSFQLTAVWYLNFCKGKMSFTGFADFWKQTTAFGDFIFLSEPQLWYNASSHFAVGGEVELSNNFGGMEGFKIMPTLGAKYTF